MGILENIFGGVNTSAQDYQRAQNERAFNLINQNSGIARNDILNLFPAGDRARNQGFENAASVINGIVPQQIDLTAEGNVRGQNQLLAGLPQFQNAILGNPVDNSALQSQDLRDLNLPGISGSTGSAGSASGIPNGSGSAQANLLAGINPNLPPPASLPNVGGGGSNVNIGDLLSGTSTVSGLFGGPTIGSLAKDAASGIGSLFSGGSSLGTTLGGSAGDFAGVSFGGSGANAGGALGGSGAGGTLAALAGPAAVAAFAALSYKKFKGTQDAGKAVASDWLKQISNAAPVPGAVPQQAIQNQLDSFTKNLVGSKQLAANKGQIDNFKKALSGGMIPFQNGGKTYYALPGAPKTLGGNSGAIAFVYSPSDGAFGSIDGNNGFTTNTQMGIDSVANQDEKALAKGGMPPSELTRQIATLTPGDKANLGTTNNRGDRVTISDLYQEQDRSR